MQVTEYVEELNQIKGKTIGIVYIFDNDPSSPRNYDAWEGDVLSDWIHAVYELHGLPLVMDVHTFINKMANKTLPPIDYLVNLSNGYFDLSTLALVPSICSYNSIPCIPCNAQLLLTGENKRLSNLIAQSVGFNVPPSLKTPTNTSITRPNSLGSSCGVHRGVNKDEHYDYFIQEFIAGFDVTVPLLYNPLEGQLNILPGVAYVPDTMDPQWFLGEAEKLTHSGYRKQIVKIDSLTKSAIYKLVEAFRISTYCRIDFRAKCDSSKQMKDSLLNGLKWNQLNFTEINPLPTIKDNINFFSSLENMEHNISMSKCLQLYNSNVRDATLTGFVLSSSILAIKAKH